MIARLGQRLGRGRAVFLTGAGVSAASGIPTFRGDDGYWTVGSKHYRPQEMATAHAFGELPEEVWSWYLHRRRVCRAASPNDGHLALVEIERLLGDQFLLVTQNIDGLHRRAGNSAERTYEIHGNLDRFRCSRDCGPESWEIAGAEVPTCPRCGALGRPHVLWFDECYDEPRYRYESSRAAARRATLLVSAGTSGQTNLPIQMGRLAQTAGALLVDINPERNPFADMALESGGVWLRTSASEGLCQLAEQLKVGQESANGGTNGDQPWLPQNTP